MSRNSMPLQDLPVWNAQGSMLHLSKKSNKRKYINCDELQLECTPTGHIQQCSPYHKYQQLLFRGKENDENQFVIARRSRRKRENVAGFPWDHLPDELLLEILYYLPLQDLLKVASVCKRWHRLVLDESLWHSVDLEGLTHMGPALQQVLKTGVRQLRCPRAFVDELDFKTTRPLQVVQMDLSSSIIPLPALEGIMSSCAQLQDLSLEGLQLSDTIIHSLAKNVNLEQLNVSGCSGFSSGALEEMLTSCQRIIQLNISWCDFTSNHIKSVVNHVSPRVTHLNLSGYRESLTLNVLHPASILPVTNLLRLYLCHCHFTPFKLALPPYIKVLVSRCQCIHTLDLSDGTLLMADSFPVLAELKCLQHLSLSRCYHIHPAALRDLAKTIPSLCMMDVFGLISDSHLPALKKEMPRVSINSRPFSAVARPTPASRGIGNHGDRAMWRKKCRLRVHL